MKKKFLAAALALTMILALAACGSSNGGDAASDGKAVVTVATSPDFPPFESLDGSEVVGIEVDILQAIAEKLDMELKLEQMDFESVIPGVQAGKFDIGMSGITVTEDRQKNCDFTQPYFLASQAIVVTPDSDITCKADLTGKTISVQTGTPSEDYCMENVSDVLAFAANNDAAAALTSGKAAAWVVDNEVAVVLAAQQGLVVLDEAMTSEPYAFAFAKGSDSLVEAFNKELNAMIEDGTVQGIFDSYGVPYVSPKQ